MFIITGSLGLVGSSASEYFLKKRTPVIGIDNNLRSYFFGKNGSNIWKKKYLKKNKLYSHYNIDIRNKKKIFEIFKKNSNKIKAIIHTAAQPSHDWAAKEPFIDYNVNTTGTLNLLEAYRKYCPSSTFVFTSTNKVYGDNPNFLPLEEKKYRFEIKKNHKYFRNGIDENMSLDQTTHSLFGVSKTSADFFVQEYGNYFNLNTVCFRGGCLTGENHSGAMLHGFLSFLVKSIVNNKNYNVFGYKGKQVRDNIHSSDLINCFWEFYKKPTSGEIYNIGGGRYSNCSILEAIEIIEKELNIKIKKKFVKKSRVGDHIWYISNNKKFMKKYPKWKQKFNIRRIILDLIYN